MKEDGHALYLLYLSLCCWCYRQALKGKSSPPGKAAIIVNGKVITTEESNTVYSSKSTDAGDKNDFINSLITKELLIQESKREGIEKWKWPAI